MNIFATLLHAAPCIHPKYNTIGSALSIILAIGALTIAGVGVAAYFQPAALSQLNQIEAIAMMAVGFGCTTLLLLPCVARSLKRHLPESKQANELLKIFNQRSQTYGWLNVIRASPMNDLEVFQSFHPLLQAELWQERFILSDQETKKLERIFVDVRKAHQKYLIKQRE